MSEASAAVYLADDSGHGETFLLADPGELMQDKMILSDPETGKPLHIVDRARFLDSGYRVVLDRPAPAERRRPRFRRRGTA
jgi:hypothetical protein